MEQPLTHKPRIREMTDQMYKIQREAQCCRAKAENYLDLSLTLSAEFLCETVHCWMDATTDFDRDDIEEAETRIQESTPINNHSDAGVLRTRKDSRSVLALGEEEFVCNTETRLMHGGSGSGAGAQDTPSTNNVPSKHHQRRIRDCIRLARTCIQDRQDQRALHILKQYDAHLQCPLGSYLAAQCLFRLKRGEEALALLGDNGPEPERSTAAVQIAWPNASPAAASSPFAAPFLSSPSLPYGSSRFVVSSISELNAALCYLRGRIYEELENLNQAVSWYQQALLKDIMCFDALARLVEGTIMSRAQRYDLIKLIRPDFSELPLNTAAAAKPYITTSPQNWLRLLYSAYIASDCMTLIELEPRTESKAKSTEKSLTGKERYLALDFIIQHLETEYLLFNHLYLLTCRARFEYEKQDYNMCVLVSEKLAKLDPQFFQFVPVFAASLLELGRKLELFSLAHRVTEERPGDAISWMVVAYYYLAIHKYDMARRYFQRATSMNYRLVSAWIGYGHCFASQDESDQAMAAYRTSSRLFPGAHLPLIYIGMEFARQMSFAHARTHFQLANELCGGDDGIALHQLGVIEYQQGNFAAARDLMVRAKLSNHRKQLSMEPSSGWMSISKTSNRLESRRSIMPSALIEHGILVMNLGHCYRRLGQYEKALEEYETAQRCGEKSCDLFVAIGMSHQLLNGIETAIENYHIALSIDPEHSIACALIHHAMAEMFDPQSLDSQV